MDADVPNEEIEESKYQTPNDNTKYYSSRPGTLAAAPSIIAINQDNFLKRLNENHCIELHTDTIQSFGDERSIEQSNNDPESERNDRVNTLSSRAVNIEAEGVAVKPLSDKSSLNVYKSVNLSVNNLLMKNKSGATGVSVEKRQIIDIKQILEQRGSKCTCRVIMKGGRSASTNND